MKRNKEELDAIIDKAAHDIREERIDPSIIEASAARVWARISDQAEDLSSETLYSEGINAMNINDHTEQIRGCDDFRSLIPAYLDGKLSTARKLLL